MGAKMTNFKVKFGQYGGLCIGKRKAPNIIFGDDQE